MSRLAPESEIDAVLWLLVRRYVVNTIKHEIGGHDAWCTTPDDQTMINYLVRQHGYMEVK